MATKVSQDSKSIRTPVKQSANGSTPEYRAGQISRDDVLQYIHEMCATLTYMSITYRCERLADLLSAATAEAEQSLGDRATTLPEMEPALLQDRPDAQSDATRSETRCAP